jgi:hypothetical protein
MNYIRTEDPYPSGLGAINGNSHVNFVGMETLFLCNKAYFEERSVILKEVERVNKVTKSR